METTTLVLKRFGDEFPSMNQAEVRAALAKCGLTTKHIESKIEVLVWWQKKPKFVCVKLLTHETNLLILDEPTNHLDVDAKEELKRAIKGI